MSLSALHLPGIQDHPDDWNKLRDALPEVSMHTLPDAVDPNGMMSDKWMDEMIQKEQRLLTRESHDILIAHSFGNHRAIRHLLAGVNVSAAVLLNPPNNEMRKCTNESRMAGSVAQQLLAPLTHDLDDESFSFMHQRHQEIFNKIRMKTLLGFLKNGMPFQELLNTYSGTTPVLIIKSENDPWKIDSLTESEQIRIVTLKKLNHYPHLSNPGSVATIIRDWLHEKGILETEFHEVDARDHDHAQV